MIVDIQIGSTVMNGSSAMRVTGRVTKDPRWNGPGWRGINIPLEAFGGNPGTTGFLPDYLASSWRHVPFEWAACPGAQVEERYVWSKGYRFLQREVRRIDVMPTVDGVDCRAEHGEGHPDCPKCWAWSERNPNARPRPVTQ